MAPSRPTIRRLATSAASAPLTRRTVLALAGASALGCAGRGQRPGAGQTYDVLIQGGTVYDGTGAPSVAADVDIAGGRIVAIGALAGAGARTLIDARGLAVAPGFIDLHSHADGTLFDDPNAESVLRQGVTTVVTGQDGFSRAPRLRAPAPSVAAGDSDRSFGSMGAFFEAIERLSPAVNVASMVGLGTVRESVIGEENRPATPEELARLVAMAARQAQHGRQHNVRLSAQVRRRGLVHQHVDLPLSDHRRRRAAHSIRLHLHRSAAESGIDLLRPPGLRLESGDRLQHDSQVPFVTTSWQTNEYITVSPYSHTFRTHTWTGLQFFRIHIPQSKFLHAVTKLNEYCVRNPTAANCDNSFSQNPQSYKVMSFGVLHEVFRGPNNQVSAGVHFTEAGLYHAR